MVDKEYQIISLSIKQTTHGTCIQCTIEDEGGQTKVFLPKSIQLNEEECDEYSEKDISLIYRGKNKNAFIIDFV